MKKLLTVFSMFVNTIFASFNEPRFEGLSIDWQEANSTEKRLDIIKQFLPDNPMIFEAGAYDGNDSMKLAYLWPNGRIISFEANPKQFIKLQQKTIHFTNINAYNLAVNTFNGIADFYLCWGTGGNDPIFEGASSLLPASESMKIHYKGPIIPVQSVILEEWCSNNQIANFDFMWLDLEGFELPFLKSSPNVLKTVKVIYTETNFFPFRQGMTQYENLHAFLELNGFTMIAHWYREGLQGDALFVRNQLLE